MLLSPTILRVLLCLWPSVDALSQRGDHPRPQPAMSSAPRAPIARLDDAEFTGLINNTIAEFLGIPFGQSTAGMNRLHLPKPVGPYAGQHNATAFGPACHQQNMTMGPPPPGGPVTIPGIPPSLDPVLGLVNVINHISEDCLSVNVYKPLSANRGDKLPVVAWIYGGGFEEGAALVYDGSLIVNRSIAVGQPIILVSMNYRLSAWGFLPGKEVREAGIGNLGLEDQRLALRWIQKYISNFGGDPTKVTIWGESAGSESVSLHLVANDGDPEGLFRAGFMQSAALPAIGDIAEAQSIFDAFAANAGCLNATASGDVLGCLRNVDGETFQKAADMIPGITSFESVNLAFRPRVDGRFLKDNPQKLLLSGKVSNVPFINGNNDDEGTLFSTQLANLTTDAESLDYMVSNYLSGANSTTMATLARLYPTDPAAGSPFDTGTANALTPQYKRLAAFQGDFLFHAPRRLLINARASHQPVWSFLNKRLKNATFLGSFHASDLVQTILGHAELQDYLINFINHLDPNGSPKQSSNSTDTLINWPQYSTDAKQLLTILDGPVPLTISKDDFRDEAIQFLLDFSLAHPLAPFNLSEIAA